MNEQVIIYKENYELISSLLTKKEKIKFFEGLFNYMFNGIEPKFKNTNQEIIFNLMIISNFMVNETLKNCKKNQKKGTKNYDKNCTR